MRNIPPAPTKSTTTAAVAGTLAAVLTGGPDADLTEPLSEAAVHKLEREALMTLIKTGPSLARMEHMLDTGKPLRN